MSDTDQYASHRASGLGFGVALWRTRAYIRPQLVHFLILLTLYVVAALLGYSVFLLGFDLLTNKVFLAEPLNGTQAWLLGLDPARYVAVERLDEAARQTLRTVFMVLIGALFAATFLLGSAITYYRTWILQRVNQQLRIAMMDNAVHLSLRRRDGSEVGDAIYRVYQDSAMVTQVVQNALVEPVMALVNFAIALATLTLFSPYLGLLFLLATAPSVAALAAFKNRLRSRSRASRLANSDLTSHIQASTDGARVLKASAAEAGALQAFRQRSHRALDRAYELRRSVAVLNLLVFTLAAVAVIAADYAMTHWVWDGDGTFGFGVFAVVGFALWNLGAFQAARGHGLALSGSCAALANLWSLLQDMSIGLRRAFLLLDAAPEVQNRPGAVALPAGAVRFSAVGFGYDPAQPVLSNVDFEARPGSVTAIVGPSGAGKSTLMSLLLRLYDVDRGAILIRGEDGDTDLRDIDVQSLRGGISLVLQENALFPASVADNIRYAAADADDEAVARAAEVACADEFIEALPAGYATELGERGAKLSTGQRQRICLARAVVKNAPILILDEPTASLDVHTERRVMERLAAWGRDKVIFFVTHRLATIRHADWIVFLEDGRVVEQGDHATLMANGGRYRQFAAGEAAA